MIKSLMVVIILIISSQVSAGKIYKWVDEDGQIHYASQKPSNQEVETVKERKGPKVAPKPATEEPTGDGTQSETEEATDAAAEEAARNQLAEADKANNKILCEQAHNNYNALNATVRVSRLNESGQAVRMTDTERVNALKNAQLGIERYCK